MVDEMGEEEDEEDEVVGLRGSGERGQDAEGDSASQIPGVRPLSLPRPPLNPSRRPLRRRPSRISTERMSAAYRPQSGILMPIGSRTGAPSCPCSRTRAMPGDKNPKII